MPTVFDNLSDTYNRHDAQLISYVDINGQPFFTPIHYDLRAFHTDDITGPLTMDDMAFWNAYHFIGRTMDSLSSLQSFTGRTFRRRLIDELSIAVDGGGTDSTYFTMGQLNQMTMHDIDFKILSLGNEEWPADDSDVVVGPDSNFRYGNSIRITLHNGVLKTVASHYADDILTDFTDPNTSFYIEMTLPGFPAQAAAAHLDLANSFIDISSNDGFDPAFTDSIPFDASLVDLTAGGNTYFRISRDSLVNANITSLRSLRFRLMPVGDFTFVTTSIRVLPGNYDFVSPRPDTKRYQLRREIPRAGAPEISQPLTVFFRDAKPKNMTIFTKINSGHSPVGNDNELSFFFRYNPTTGDYIQVKLLARSTQSRLRIYENLNGVLTEIYSTAINTNILSTTTEYMFKVDLQEDKINASIYTENGVYLNAVVYSTGSQQLYLNGRGYFGYTFAPYNYDFTLESISTHAVEFAAIESTSFASRTLVTGATLFTSASLPTNFIDPTAWLANGDASFLTDSDNHIDVTRVGNQWYGGIYQPLDFWGDLTQVTIEGELNPGNFTTGGYHATIIENEGRVIWISPSLTNILPNQWNHFKLSIATQAPATETTLFLYHTGFYASSYSLRNISVNYNTVSWYASLDNGTNWTPFLDAINSPYTGIKFNTRSTSLRVRATVHEEDAWIQGYQLVPKYLYSGHRH